MPYTILYVHSSDEMYGADLILLQLVKHLDKQRFRPIVVVPTDVTYQGQLTQALTANGISVIHLKTAILRRKYFTPWGMAKYLWRLMASTLSLMHIIRREAVDIIHTNTASIIPGALAARLTVKPHVWHIHEIIVHPRLLWRLTAWLLPRLSDRIVAVSGPTRDHLCAGDHRNTAKTIVIHNGIDRSRIEAGRGLGCKVREEWGLTSEHQLVGMIGRISHWKGQRYFLEVASLVAQTHPNAWFAVVGGVFPGQEALIDELRTTAKHLGLSARLIISDFRGDIPSVLDALDVFVLPSTLPDPFPTVVLEAMAAAKPVVANAHGGSIEMIDDQITGLLVRPGKTDEMAYAISRLLDDPALRAAMGKAGRERLITYFSLEAFNAQWQALYEKLVSTT